MADARVPRAPRHALERVVKRALTLDDAPIAPTLTDASEPQHDAQRDGYGLGPGRQPYSGRKGVVLYGGPVNAWPLSDGVPTGGACYACARPFTTVRPRSGINSPYCAQCVSP